MTRMTWNDENGEIKEARKLVPTSTVAVEIDQVYLDECLVSPCELRWTVVSWGCTKRLLMEESKV